MGNKIPRHSRIFTNNAKASSCHSHPLHGKPTGRICLWVWGSWRLFWNPSSSSAVEPASQCRTAAYGAASFFVHCSGVCKPVPHTGPHHSSSQATTTRGLARPFQFRFDRSRQTMRSIWTYVVTMVVVALVSGALSILGTLQIRVHFKNQTLLDLGSSPDGQGSEKH